MESAGKQFPEDCHAGTGRKAEKGTGRPLALVLVVLAFIYFNKTKQGYEIAVVGQSNNTARYAGINVSKVFIRTMFLSGAMCGLVGMLQFAGADYTITEGTAGWQR